MQRDVKTGFHHRVFYLVLLAVLFVVSAGFDACGADADGELEDDVAPVAYQPPDSGRFDLQVLGRPTVDAGGHAAFRMVTLDAKRGTPVAGVHTRISVSKQGENQNIPVFAGYTDNSGTIEADFPVPELEPGTYKATFLARGGDQTEKLTQAVVVQQRHKIYLTTDKPLYQPGQTMHLRALALNASSLKPLSGKALTFVVADGKGNKVFREKMELNSFGVASAEFSLASEVNMGDYKITAEIPSAQAEMTVTVKRYVLPKFKVTFTTDKAFYRPDEIIKGTIDAQYLFGKPVSGATVEIVGRTPAAGEQTFFTHSGKTGDNGLMTFETKLPSYLAGHPLLKGKALLSFTATVEDGAQHREQATRNVAAGKNALSVEAFIDGGQYKPGLPNTLFVVVADGAGNPAEAKATLVIDGMKIMNAETSDMGVATFTFTGPEKAEEAFFTVVSNDGEKLNKQLYLQNRHAEHELAFVTDKAVYEAGDTMTLTAFSTLPSGTVFVDLIKDGQTILTTTGTLDGGRAEWSYDIPVDAFGLMTANAYFLKPSLNFVRATRRVMIQPAGDLSIAISADKKQYKPGETARLTITTTDEEGQPTPAAVGLYIVDEAVFALAERAPGLEKVFFLLEKEIMTPRWQITAFAAEDLIRPMPTPQKIEAAKQEAGRALFAAMDQPMPEEPFRLSSYEQTIQKTLLSAWDRFYEAVERYNNESSQKWTGDVDALYGIGSLMKKDLVDPWDALMQPKYTSCYGMDMPYLQSAGPDGKFDTKDDLVVSRGNLYGYLWESSGHGLPKDLKQLCREMMQRRRMKMMRGGAGRGLAGMAMEEQAPVMDKVAMAEAMPSAAPVTGSADNDGGLAKVTKVREYFPETLYVEPSLITDERGMATREIEVADSITTWRVVASGSDQRGRMGAYKGGLVCFQDFFIDPDLPLSLTAGDEIAIPVAVYNYLDEAQTVQLELKAADWFTLKDDAKKTIKIGPGDVTAVRFRIQAMKPGMQTIEIHGRGTKLADAVRKPIEVVPNGFAVPIAQADMLEKSAEMDFTIPAEALDGGTGLWLRLYPAALSEVIDGMEKMLRMPSGCFEQTSSTTYPNLLVLDYMTQTGKITPEIQMKAETLVAHGYQRLLTFEVDGGGYEWFGNAPANKILTAYGVLEFSDMARVHEVDAAMLARTTEWLLKQQEGDGRWTPDQSYLHAESWSKIQGQDLLVTAYIAWALAEAGVTDARVSKALGYIKRNLKNENSPYILGLAANALLAANPKDTDGQALLEKLVELSKDDGDGGMYWKGEATVTYARGPSADIETTGMIALAMLKSNAMVKPLGKILRWLIRNKDAYGTWHSTQGTIYVLKALLKSQLGSKQGERMTVAVTLDGKALDPVAIEPDKSDLMHQIDLGADLTPGAHKVSLALTGGGPITYQIAGRYYLPWSMQPPQPKPLIALDVQYDRTKLAVNDTVTCTVTAKLNVNKTAKMVMLDVGIPPGFSVQTDALVAAMESGQVQRFSQTPRQVMLYLDELTPNKPFRLSFTMRARYPIRASIPEHEAYLYYDPQTRTTKAPSEMLVKE